MTTLPKVVRTCLANPALKAKLIADPTATLAEHGLKVPAGITVKVVENTASVFHLVLPSTSASGELCDEELASAAGGWNPYDGDTDRDAMCTRMEFC